MNTHLESCPMTNILAYKTLKEAFVSINHEGDNAQKYLERSIFKTLKEVSATIHKAKTLREQCAPYTTIALPLFMLHLRHDLQFILVEGSLVGSYASHLRLAPPVTL
uniref:Uncharacterized protein n=1 Tax=Pristionchus pacificus TaxID=54126 RepID=A0A2A6BD08_PRIPA|eukprot:PDM63758.1 hypothetical protein PRIPAC_49731 [Pristionchus pacificus]